MEFIRTFIEQVNVSITLETRIREVPNSNLVQLLAKITEVFPYLS